MVMSSDMILIINISMTLLSLGVFAYLICKYIKYKDKSYKVHSLTKLLAAVSFFIFIDSLYEAMLFASNIRLLPLEWFFFLSEPNISLIPSIAIFISILFVIHFIFDKKIEEFKDKEESVAQLEHMNKELEHKAKEMEESQEVLEKKVKELEKFNDIAKKREIAMLDQIKMIEALEEKLKKKGNK